MIYMYDGSYEGLLSAIFEVLGKKEEPTDFHSIEKSKYNILKQSTLLSIVDWQAQRVEKMVNLKTNKEGIALIKDCFYSEMQGVEMLIYQFVVNVVGHTENWMYNYKDSTLGRLRKINSLIKVEVFEILDMVTFDAAGQDVNLVILDPEFHILPLLRDHFSILYPSDRWMIYDVSRAIGVLNIEGDCVDIALTPTVHQDMIARYSQRAAKIYVGKCKGCLGRRSILHGIDFNFMHLPIKYRGVLERSWLG